MRNLVEKWRVTDEEGVVGYGPYYNSPLSAALSCGEGDVVVQVEVDDAANL